jgi:hypothetical protein
MPNILVALALCPWIAVTAAAQSQTFGSLTPVQTSANDKVGESIDVSGAVAVIGGPNHDGVAPAPHGGAWIYERTTSGNWTQTEYLLPADLPLQAEFGAAVAADGDWVMVGAPGDNTLFPGSSGSGSAYVYRRQPGGSWLQTQKLYASDATLGADFGNSIAIDGDLAVVGAPLAQSLGGNTGAAYVFERQPNGLWTEIAKVVEIVGTGSDKLGFDVAISGERVLLGAHQQDDSGISSGAAYLFERQADGSWPRVATLLASDGAAGDFFGYSVALSGDRAVCGAYLDDDQYSGSGSAYLFERQGNGTWLQVQKVIALTDLPVHFGQAVAIDGDIVLVGCLNEIVEFHIDAGAVHVWRRTASGLYEPLEVLHHGSGPGTDERFGKSVAIDGGLIAVGSNEQDEVAPDGGLGELFYGYAGSPTAGPLVQGTGSPGCNGPQVLGTNSPTLIASAGFGFTCTNAPPSSPGFLLIGTAADVTGSDLLGLGVLLHVDLLASASTLLLPFASDALGSGFASVPIPDSPTLVGAVLHAQGLWIWSSCPLPPLGLSSSKLLSITIGSL